MPRFPLADRLEQAFAEIQSWSLAPEERREAQSRRQSPEAPFQTQALSASSAGALCARPIRRGRDPAPPARPPEPQKKEQEEAASPHTDLLLLYDRFPPERREALLKAWFPEPSSVALFRYLVQDRIFRGVVEFRHNDALPYEEFRHLLAEGWLRLRGRFPITSRRTRGRSFERVARTGLRLPETLTLPAFSSIGPVWFLGPFVEAYLCRDLGAGVVAGPDLLRAALETEDEELLSFFVDPHSGAPLFPDLARKRKEGLRGAHWGSEEIRRLRRELNESWSLHPDRGVEILDLSRREEAPEHLPRNLPWDQEVLNLLREREASA